MVKNILENVLSGVSDKNIKFSDLRKLIWDLGFGERIRGSHHIFLKKALLKL